jgi:hypothetical protein
MVPISALWLPILLSAAIVFAASCIIHMVLPYHRGDFRGVPKEDEVMEALRRFNIPPGDYMMPHARSCIPSLGSGGYSLQTTACKRVFRQKGR